MDFFRPNIEERITLPSPPQRDEDEISRLKDIIRNRTAEDVQSIRCLLYTSPSPRDPIGSRMPSSA